jgi:nicotinamidase-related amidase
MIEQLDPHIKPQLDHSALLVIDTQVDFVDGGTFPVPAPPRFFPPSSGCCAPTGRPSGRSCTSFDSMTATMSTSPAER